MVTLPPASCTQVWKTLLGGSVPHPGALGAFCSDSHVGLSPNPRHCPRRPGKETGPEGQGCSWNLTAEAGRESACHCVSTDRGRLGRGPCCSLTVPGEHGRPQLWGTISGLCPCPKGSVCLLCLFLQTPPLPPQPQASGAGGPLFGLLHPKRAGAVSWVPAPSSRPAPRIVPHLLMVLQPRALSLSKKGGRE